MSNEIIVCFDCKEALRLTEYDNCPEYNVKGEGEFIEEIEKDDRADFQKEHDGHKVSILNILEGEVISRGYFTEPLNESILKATDGMKNYYIRSFRNNIADKLNYELLDENIVVKIEHIGFDSEEFLESLNNVLMKEKMKKELKDRIMDVVNKNMDSVDESFERVSDSDLTSDKEIAVASKEWKEKVLDELNKVIRNEEDKRIKEIVQKKLDDIHCEIVPRLIVQKEE